MDKRKGIILAVVIFLLIGLGTFVFANPSNESLNGNDNNSNNNDNTQNDNLDNENTNDGSGEEGEDEEDTPEADSNRGNSNSGSGSNSGLAQGDDEEDSTDVIIGDDSENQGGNADEETPGDDDQNGEEPSEPIDTSAPIVTILDKTYQGLGNAIGYVNTDVVLSLTEKNLTVTIEKDGETLTFEDGMTLSSDGAYKLTVSDSNSNVTVVEFSIDKSAPVNTEIIFKNIDGNEQYAKVGDRVWLYLTFDERLAQDPTVTINGETAKRVQYKNGDNQDQDWEQYVFEYVVPEDVTEGKITFEVTNVIDKAGNPLKDTITNTNTEDTVNADVTLPERGYSTLGFEYTESNDKDYEEIDGKKIYYVKEGDSFQYKIAFTEELQDGLIATIAGTPVELEFLTYNDANGYVYGGEYLVPAGLTEGEELEIIVSNIKDLAGNEYADKTITDVPTSNGRVAVYDGENPEIIVKKWPAVDNPKPLEENGVYNYCVVAQASDTHLYSFKLDGTNYTENTPICNNGIHELTATDYAGNTKTFKFEIDGEYASVIINGKDEYNSHDTETIHVYQEITSIEFSESVTVRLTYNNNSNPEYFGSSDDFKYTFVDGLYKIELFDKGGNPTLVMIKVDGTAPQPAYLSFRVDGDATSGVDTYYATNGDRLYISFASDEKLGQEPIYILTDSEGNEFTYSRTEEMRVNNIGQYIYTSYVDVNSEVDFADGTITARVENIVDEAGNGYTKELKSSSNIKIDKTSPIAKRTYWSNDPIAWGSEFDETKLPIEYSDNISEIENLIVSEKYTFKAAGSTTYDDSITGIDTKKAGLYYRYLTVTDEAGNVSETISIPYEVVDNEAPVITKKVESDIYVPVGTKLEIKDLVTATDNNDGDITDLVYLHNEYDTNVIGDYLFEFYVLDSSGNRGYTPLRVHVVSNEAYASSIVETINYVGNERKEINILSSVTIKASDLNIPEGKTINGNGLLNIEGMLEISNSNVTLNDVNITNDIGAALVVSANASNISLNRGVYVTTNHDLQGQGVIRIGDIYRENMYNGNISIKGITAKGSIQIYGYNGSIDNIVDNNITLEVNDGKSNVGGIIILTPNTEYKKSLELMNNQKSINVNYSSPLPSYYTLIQNMEWEEIDGIQVLS